MSISHNMTMLKGTFPKRNKVYFFVTIPQILILHGCPVASSRSKKTKLRQRTICLILVSNIERIVPRSEALAKLQFYRQTHQ